MVIVGVVVGSGELCFMYEMQFCAKFVSLRNLQNGLHDVAMVRVRAGVSVTVGAWVKV